MFQVCTQQIYDIIILVVFLATIVLQDLQVVQSNSCSDIGWNKELNKVLYFSQKQLPFKMKMCLVIIECTGYTLRQLLLRQLLISVCRNL